MALTMIPSSFRLPPIFIICHRLSKNAPEAARMTYPCSGEIVMVIFISEFISRVPFNSKYTLIKMNKTK
jgi:hypothetical protein